MNLYDLSKVVGMGSRLHVPFEEDIIIFLTLSSVAGLKQNRGQLTSLGSMLGTLSGTDGKFDRIVSIFCQNIEQMI